MYGYVFIFRKDIVKSYGTNDIDLRFGYFFYIMFSNQKFELTLRIWNLVENNYYVVTETSNVSNVI